MPTVIVDKRGRQTTVHKKPMEASLSASKGFPAPATQKSSGKQREELEARVSKLFPQRWVVFVKGKMGGFSDETVETIGSTAQRIIDNPKLNADLATYAGIIREVEALQTPEHIFQFISNHIDNTSDEVSLGTLKDIYDRATGPMKEPVADDELDAHVHAANSYFDMAIKADRDIAFSYISNKSLFKFVARHPDKVDLIFQHYLTYYPEQNGYEDFERDLDRLSELSKPVGEGWL